MSTSPPNSIESELTDGTIRERELPEGIRRFAQAGHEHPRLYSEYLVECEGPDRPSYAPMRGRATSEDAAIMSYRTAFDPPVALEIVRFTVREIVEG